MDAKEKLEQFTIKTGAPFPFSVEQVNDLSKWKPKPLTVAVDKSKFRVMDAGEGKDNRTANRLRRIVEEITEGSLSEWQPTTHTATEIADPGTR